MWVEYLGWSVMLFFMLYVIVALVTHKERRDYQPSQTGWEFCL